jgi:hypothetical protein
MRKILTYTALIKTGVVTRNEGFGNTAPMKKMSTAWGIKPFWSDKMYKRALYDCLKMQNNGEWHASEVSNVGGVQQKVSTIIDSEEFDCAGTMVPKPFPYSRLRCFAPTPGIALGVYKGDTEMITNMGLVKCSNDSDAKTSILNRDVFYGIYKVSGVIDLDAIGEQTIIIPSKVSIKDIDAEDIETADITSFFGKIFEVVEGKMKSENKTVPMTSEEFASSFQDMFQDMSFDKIDANKGSKLTFTVSDIYKEYVKNMNKKDEAIKAIAWKLQKGDLLLTNNQDEIENSDNTEVEKDKFLIGEISGDYKELAVWVWKYLTIKWKDKEGICDATLKHSAGKTKKEKVEYTLPDTASIPEKIKWLYDKVIKEYLDYDDSAESVSRRADIVDKMEIKKEAARFIVNISLTKKEKARRVKKLVEAITTVRRTTEARTEVLHPDFIVWSTELPTVLLHNVIENIVSIDGNGNISGIDKEKLKKYTGQKEGEENKVITSDVPISIIDEVYNMIDGYYQINKGADNAPN